VTSTVLKPRQTLALAFTAITVLAVRRVAALVTRQFELDAAFGDIDAGV
jgi:hypothetical protein